VNHFCILMGKGWIVAESEHLQGNLKNLGREPGLLGRCVIAFCLFFSP
jgi:hypothetical protein